jgi:zinc protease
MRTVPVPIGNDAAPRFPVARWQLANGLRVVVQADPSWPLIASTMCYDAGSRCDPASRSGLAHVCEHLAFYGPRRASACTLPGRIESAGGSAQAMTMPDRLCFSSTFPRAALAEMLAVEAERMAQPLESSDTEALEIQRRILLEELHQRSQSRPRAMAFEQLHRMLFPEAHPYHRPPAGEPDGIRAITAEDVRAFSASHFSPRNAVLVFAGDLSVDEAADLVSRTFEAVPAGTGHAREAREAISAGPPRQDVGPRRVRAAVARPHAYVAWLVPGFGQQEWYLATLLMRALTAGRSSPLARELVDRAGLAQEVRGHVVTMRDASTLVFVAVAARGVDSDRLDEGLVDAIDRLLSSGLSASELERARKKALSEHYFMVQNLDRRADLCASLSCYLDAPERLEAESRHYAQPDRDAIAAFASTLRADPARARLSIIPLAEPA